MMMISALSRLKCYFFVG